MSADLPILASGPERAFRLGEIAYDGHRVSASMPAGPWLAGADGTTAAGAVGVLFDNVLGYALIGIRPAGGWSISAEITLDVLEPLPAHGRLHAEAEVVHGDALGGFSTGRITDDSGRVLAVGTQRGRFVPAPDGGVAASAHDPLDGGDDVVGRLRRTYAGGEPFVVPEMFANPLGNVHGGISLCLSDLVARGAVGEHLTTASVQMTYTRAIPVGSTLSYAAEVRHAGRTLAVVDVTGTVDGRPGTLARVVLHPRAS